MRSDPIDEAYGSEYARTARRRRRVLVVLLGLALVSVLAVVGLSRLDVAHTDGALPTTSTGPAVPTAPPALALRAVPSPRPGVESYTVRAGDTLEGIAHRVGRAPAAIAARNRLATPDHLSIGQRLVIPAAPVLRVSVVSASALGVRVRMAVRGQEREQIVFTVRSPTGTYVGPSHPLDPDGVVRATYDAPPTPGRYDVSAKGDRGTSAAAAFDLAAR